MAKPSYINDWHYQTKVSNKFSDESKALMYYSSNDKTSVPVMKIVNELKQVRLQPYETLN